MSKSLQIQKKETSPLSQENLILKFFSQGFAFHQIGDLDSAQLMYDKVLEVDSNHFDALQLSGVIALQKNKNNVALDLISQAIKINPKIASTHLNLGIAQNALKQYENGISSFNEAIAIKPDYAEAYLYRANVLKELSKVDEALVSYGMALKIRPNYAEVYYSRGIVLHEVMRYEEAILSYDHAINLKPEYADAYLNRGNTLKEQGFLSEAIESYRKAIAIKPDYAEAYLYSANALKELNKIDNALVSYGMAINIRPNYAEAYYSRGILFHELIRYDEAILNYDHAISFKPDYADAYLNRGNTLKEQGALSDAIESYRKAIAIKPDYASASSNILFLLTYGGLVDAQKYLVFSKEWERGALTEIERSRAKNKVFKRCSPARRRLRVGYISGDYRQHPVSFFIEELFKYHNKNRVEVFAYSTHPSRDEITARLEGLVENWVSVSNLSNEAIQTCINNDKIDVLVDLSGHSAHNRLEVFANRAAPVQAHYLGFPNSTGLTEMDYWIGDQILSPQEIDHHFQEQVLRLPRVWLSYKGSSTLTKPQKLQENDSKIWLGSFNNLSKLTPETLVLWAKILHALPEGQLLLKTKQLANESNRRKIYEVMASHGVSSKRIELQDSSITPNWHAHMEYYSRLDIALDPIGGVGGGTTTCDALWMGVPVITLMGESIGQRMTASMLDAICHSEWIAHSESEYINKVIDLGRNIEMRKILRINQRQQMSESPLCDSKGLAKALEDSYELMFNKWYQENQLLYN